MPIDADLDNARFTLAGSDCEPESGWARATVPQRRGYWAYLAKRAYDEKIRELNAGVGVDGSKLARRLRPRRDRADGPPLLPHWTESRFRTELGYEATQDQAVLYWRAPWAEIVGYHARGEVPGAPVRNVVGLTDRGFERVVNAARKWWATQVATGRRGEASTMHGKLPAGTGAQVRQAEREAESGGRPYWLGEVLPTPKATVVPQPPPVVRGGTPPWEIVQQLHGFLQSAGLQRTGPAQVDAAARRLGNTHTLATLVDVLYRLGVDEVPTSKAAAVDMLRRVLLDRLRTGRAA